MFVGCLPLLPGNKEDYLRKAAETGDERAVKKLLKAGVPADPSKSQHTSSLQLAARCGHLEVVKLLVDAGADINRVVDGSSLLDAAAHGHVDVVKYLLSNKADTAATWNGSSAVHMAARCGHQAVIDALSTQLDISCAITATNGEGKTPLMLACSQLDDADGCVAYLLSAGADAAAEDLAGNTALHHAAVAGNLAAAKLLLTSGPRGLQTLNMVNNKGRTPLHVAAVFGRQQLLQTLLKLDNARVDAKDKEGGTVLHMVCKSIMCTMAGQEAMAQAVLARGADPEAKDDAGNTPAQYSSYACVKALLQSAAEAKVAAEKNSQAGTAAKKSSKLAGALDGAMAALSTEGADETSWVVKQALRRHTSEEADGWKLTTAADEEAVIDDAIPVSTLAN